MYSCSSPVFNHDIIAGAFTTILVLVPLIPMLVPLIPAPLMTVSHNGPTINTNAPVASHTNQMQASSSSKDATAKLGQSRQPRATTSSPEVQVSKPNKLSVSIETLLLERCVALLTSHEGSMLLSVLASDEEVTSLWQEVKGKNKKLKLKTFLLSCELFTIHVDRDGGQGEVVSMSSYA